MTWLRVAWRAIQLVVHLLVGAILTLMTSRRLKGDDYRHKPRVVSWWHARALRIMCIQVEVTGPRPNAPALLVSNHVSWLDIPVIGSLVDTGFLSKYEVRRWPLMGWLAAAAGTLFIKRGNGEAGSITQTIAARLHGGGLLTLFPEGTTTDGRDVRPFFSRLFGAALESGTRVVPIGLHYHVDGQFDPIAPFIDEQTLADNLLGLLQRKHSRVRVTFCAPLETRDMDRKGTAKLARHAIREAIGVTIPGATTDTEEISATSERS